MKQQHNHWIAIFATTLLCSCGGGSDSGDSAGIDASGSPIASQGTIDGFGSVIVNGVRFDSSKATILINGQSAIEDNLHVGYHVNLTGHIDANNAGVADKIEYFPELIGEITQIDVETNQIEVLNRRVQLNHRTLFANNISPNDIRGLKVGDKVLISGPLHTTATGVATRIELSNDLIQLAGVISNLDLTNQRFNLDNTLVNYAGATLVNFSQLTNNMQVSVRGNKDANGNILAQQIFNIKIEFDSKIKKAEVEGTISRFVSTTDFDVNGMACTTTTQTVYKKGNATDLKLGANLEIKGSINANGILAANSVELEMEDDTHLEGQVSSINISSTDNIVTGSLVIGTVTVKTDSATRYEDKGEGNVRRFNLASIAVGNYLEVTGYNQNNEFIATKIERKPAENKNGMEFELEGKISVVGTNSISLLGQTIILTEATEIKGENGKLDLASFLSSALNMQVEVRGTITDGVYTATRVEIKD
jgi:Domain of unknown function (DUF5666)